VLIGKLRQYRVKSTNEYSADPLITRLYQMISRYHVDLQWIKGHPETRAKLKRKDWSPLDIGIYIADQMTRGEVDDLAPLRFHCDNITPTVIQFRNLLPDLAHCTTYQYRRSDNVPLAEYQMRLLHRQNVAAKYLHAREQASLAHRNIPWTQLSIPLAVQALEYNRFISKTRIVKTVYDLYDDDLHKTEDNLQYCPLCRVEKDTTEHLFSCCNEDAIAMVNCANIAQQQLPTPQELYECDSIDPADTDRFRHTIIRMINFDAQTRIGMFNKQQQAHIVAVIPGLHLRDDTENLLGVISRYIVQLLQPTISATLGLIVLRNTKKAEIAKLKQQRDGAKTETEKKKRIHESRNPYHLLFPEEPLPAVPTPVICYEICYGSPAVKVQIVVRTPEEAINAVSRLTEILPSMIDIYRLSDDHPDCHVRIHDLSPQHTNIITSRDNIFSPLLLFPGNYGLHSFNRYRTIRQPYPQDKNNLLFINLIVRLERLIESGHLSRFRDFLRRCSQHAEDADNRYAINDIQTIQASVLHKESLTSVQLHLALMWSPVAGCLQRTVRYSISTNISSGFSSDQMYHLDRTLSSLPQIACYQDNDVAVYHSTVPGTHRRPSRHCKVTQSPESQPSHNTPSQCRTFHKEGKHAPKISTFPRLPSLPQPSSFEALGSLQESVATLSHRYESVAQQNVDVRDTAACQRIISDTETLLTEDEQIPCLSVAHRRYLRDKLRRAINQVRTIQQETVAYDPSPRSHRQPQTSILSFLIRQARLDNQDPPD
jgi:hypothetical protein